jgi:hypothetical protein
MKMTTMNTEENTLLKILIITNRWLDSYQMDLHLKEDCLLK